MDTEIDEVGSSSHGVSILKEIFPDHGSADGPAALVSQHPPLHQLLGSIPSPARNLRSSGRGVVATTPLAAPAIPPPPLPPMLPAQTCLQAQDAWNLLDAALPPLTEPSFSSYRERLRAGGRGALQRAFDAGLVPKSMKHDPRTRPQTHAHTIFQQQPEKSWHTHVSIIANVIHISGRWSTAVEHRRICEQRQ